MEIQLLDISGDDINNEYIVTLYGKTIDDKNIICHMSGFKPYFYLKVPNSYTEKYCKDIFLKKIYNDYNTLIDIKHKDFKLKSYKEFYNYHVDEYDQIKKFSFLKLIFHTYKNYVTFKKKIKEFYSNNIGTTNTKIKSFLASPSPL